MEEAQAGFVKFLNVLIKGQIRYFFKFTCKNIFKNIKAENHFKNGPKVGI